MNRNSYYDVFKNLSIHYKSRFFFSEILGKIPFTTENFLKFKPQFLAKFSLPLPEWTWGPKGRKTRDPYKEVEAFSLRVE